MKPAFLLKYDCLRIRLPLFVMDLVMLILGISLYFINKERFMELLYNPVILLIFLILVAGHIFPRLLNDLLSKYCTRETADCVIPISDDINKIKNDIKNASVKKTGTEVVATKFLKKGSANEIDELLADLKAKKYRKVMLRAKNKLKSGSGINYNILLEIAYSEQSTSDYDIKERIENLGSIIRKEMPVQLKMAFILTYISCNLYIDEYDLVEKAIYRAIDITNKAELDPIYLSRLYRLQMDSFILQNRISEAISNGKKALEYADSKDRCGIYFSLSKIYFYFLDDNKLSLENALLAWNDIYKDAPFVKELVQLCYITLFFDAKVNEACDFLLNFTDNETDDGYKDNLSYLLYKKGDVKSAKNNAAYCMSQNPTEAVASMNTLAMIEKDEKQFEQAIYHFSEVIPSLEGNKQVKLMKYFWLEAIYNRGVCYIKLGNFEKAKTDIELAIKERYADMDADILKEYYDLNPEHIVS